MDGLILIAAAILNPRARRRRVQKQSEESTAQDVGAHPDRPTVNETTEKERTELDQTTPRPDDVDTATMTKCTGLNNPTICTIRPS
jgi:hypothetical protein